MKDILLSTQKLSKYQTYSSINFTRSGYVPITTFRTTNKDGTFQDSAGWTLNFKSSV